MTEIEGRPKNAQELERLVDAANKAGASLTVLTGQSLRQMLADLHDTGESHIVMPSQTMAGLLNEAILSPVAHAAGPGLAAVRNEVESSGIKLAAMERGEAITLLEVCLVGREELGRIARLLGLEQVAERFDGLPGNAKADA